MTRTAPYMSLASDYAATLTEGVPAGDRDLRGRADADRRPARLDLVEAIRSTTYGDRSSSCSAASRTRPSLRSPTPLPSASSSGRSSPRSRRSRMHSRRRTNTPTRTPAGSPTCRCASGASWVLPACAQAPRARRALPRHRQDRHPGVDPAEARSARRRRAELIETHPALGERILAPIEQLADVRPIVRACHERWDGTGYPDRLGATRSRSRRGSSSPATRSMR